MSPVTTDGDALRRAVLADPDEDTPRLIYADWLDENGQPDRAGFIRAQIEAVRAGPSGLRARAAEDRAERLRAANRGAWARSVRHVLGAHFERGFVGRVEVEPQSFVPHAAALFAAEPVQALKVFRFQSTTGFVPLRPVFELPELGRVRRLEFASGLGLTPEEFGELSASPNLAGLRDLAFGVNPVPPAWLAAVLCGDAFPELAGLSVAALTHLGPSLAGALDRAGHRDLRRLDVSDVRFTSDQLKQLLGGRCLRRAEELRLGWSGRPGQAGPLFHLDLGWVLPWDRLTVLDLRGQRLGDEAVREVVRTRDAAGLRWLGLADNGLTREAVRLLAGSPHLDLNHLDVRGNGFGPAELAALHARFPNAVIEG